MTSRRNPVDPVDDVPGKLPAAARRTDLLAVTVLALVLCAALAVYWFTSVVSEPTAADQTPRGLLISSMYDPPETAIENGIVKGDGQLFAGQATDPLVRRPQMVRGPESEQAYRYQRPVYGWLGWAASAGRPGAVAVALIAVTVLSATLLAFACARWLFDRGSDARWALVVLLLPGVVVDITWIGPEALGVALVVLGLYRWLDVPGRPMARERDLPASTPPDWIAVACLATAGLCRETMLLVPFVLMITAAGAGRWRRAVGAALAAAPYVVWVLVLKVRIGAWPEGSVDGRLSLLPFGGMFEAAGGWASAEYGFAALILGLAVAALVLGAGSGLRALVAVQLVLAATMGEAVWNRFPDFGRVLLPLGVLSLLAVIPAVSRRADATPDAAPAELRDLVDGSA